MAAEREQLRTLEEILDADAGQQVHFAAHRLSPQFRGMFLVRELRFG